MFFFFNDTATTEIYTLSLHDALPIYPLVRRLHVRVRADHGGDLAVEVPAHCDLFRRGLGMEVDEHDARSEEHTSELQSPCNLVCRLLLEKKKNENKV